MMQKAKDQDLQWSSCGFGAELGTLTKMFNTVLVGMKSKTSQRWQPMIVPLAFRPQLIHDLWAKLLTIDILLRNPMNSDEFR